MGLEPDSLPEFVLRLMASDNKEASLDLIIL
jgi:hypothetical protein